MKTKKLNVDDLVELVQNGEVVASCPVYRTTEVHAFVLNKTIVTKLRRDYHLLLEQEMKLICPGALISNSTYWRAHESLRTENIESNAVQISPWTNVEIELPEPGQIVLCVDMTTEKKQVIQAKYNGESFVFTNLYGKFLLVASPTHWMPCVKLPNEGE